MATLPTVGRIMHYYRRYPDSDGDKHYAGPHAIIISDVHEYGESISGCVFSPAGLPTAFQEVPVIQPEDLPEVLIHKDVEHFVAWMPYQVATHAAAEEIKSAT